jgi:hypothetical protein
MFPPNSQRISPISIEMWLKKLERQSVSTNKTLNEAYEAVYKMNAERGIYEEKVTTATYRWLLCCKTLLDATEVLQLVLLSLNHDSELKEFSKALLRSLGEDTILYVSVYPHFF